MNTPTPASGNSANHGYIGEKDRYLARLKRIEGQTRGIHRMIDENAYCIDILTQICVADAISDGQEADAKIEEASAAIARLVKS